jgi:tetratricopeptide (TPR) repeat protein
MSRLDKLNRMLQADPGDAFVLYAIAQEHAREGRHGVAIEFYDRCLTADPAYLYAYYHKAVSQREAGDPPGARATLTRGIEAAKAAGDLKALREAQALLDSLD